MISNLPECTHSRAVASAIRVVGFLETGFVAVRSDLEMKVIAALKSQKEEERCCDLFESNFNLI